MYTLHTNMFKKTLLFVKKLKFMKSNQLQEYLNKI